MRPPPRLLAIRTRGMRKDVGWHTSAAALVLMSGVLLSFTPLVFRSVHCRDWQYALCRLLGLWIASCIGLASSVSVDSLTHLLCRSKLVLAGVLMAVANVSFVVALARIDSATTILMQGFAPIVSALVGRMVPPIEHVDRHTLFSIMLALGGLGLMGTTWAADDTIGLLAAGLIPLGLGGYTVIVRRTPEDERHAWAPLFWAGAIGVVSASTMTAATGGFAMAPHDALLGLASGGLILGTGLALYNAGAQHLTPARSSLLINTELVLAPLWTWIFVSEQPALRTALGGALVLLALVWLVTHPPRAAAPKMSEYSTKMALGTISPTAEGIPSTTRTPTVGVVTETGMQVGSRIQ